MLSTWLLYVVSICVVAANASFLSIYLESPSNGESILSQSGETATVPVVFSLFGIQQDTLEADRYEFCFEIDSNSKGIKTFPFICMETKHQLLDLANFRPGQYSISAVLLEKATNEILESTRITNTFSVVSYLDTLPSIDVSSSAAEMVIAANSLSGVAALEIPFQLLPSMHQSTYVDIAKFTVCAKVEDRDTHQVLVPWTCLKNSDRRLSLNQLQRGHSYDVYLRLRDSKNIDKSLNSLLISTEVVRTVIIRDLLELVPSISMARITQEYGVEKDGMTEMQFLYELMYLESNVLNVVNQLYVCLNLLYSASPSEFDNHAHDIQTLVEYSCVSAQNDYLSLTNMRAGFYKASLSISIDQRTPVTNVLVDTISDSVTRVEVHTMEEFIPSYEWKPLHAWHTIPSGIETRLPIGNSPLAKKEARIPNPWRLQLSLPKHLCKKAFFLRMDVFRSTTLADILNEVSTQCGPHSHSVKFHHHKEESAELVDSVRGDKEADRNDPGDQVKSSSNLPISCFALVIHSRIENPEEEHVGSEEQSSSDVIKVAVVATSVPSIQRTFGVVHASQLASHYEDATPVTVESADLFNSLHKEILWIGQDFPDHCPQLEIF